VRLKDFLDEYIEALELLKEGKFKLFKRKTSPYVREGYVYEIETDGTPILLLAAKVDEEYAEVVPLSWLWELATKYDMVIEFSHPLRDVWIAQLDLAMEIPKEILHQAEEVGKVKDVDLEVIKKVLNDEIEIPKHRRGKGYEDEVHSKFKEIEFDRHKWLFESLLSSMGESEEKVLILTYPLRKTLEECQPLAAASSKTLIKLSFGEILYNEKEKRVEVFFKEELLGKDGTLFFELNGEELVLYSGRIKDLVIPDVPEKLFNLFQLLKLEIKGE